MQKLNEMRSPKIVCGLALARDDCTLVGASAANDDVDGCNEMLKDAKVRIHCGR